MEYVRKEWLQAIMLSIDMDKAYDRVKWSNVLAVLEGWALGKISGEWWACYLEMPLQGACQWVSQRKFCDTQIH